MGLEMLTMQSRVSSKRIQISSQNSHKNSFSFFKCQIVGRFLGAYVNECDFRYWTGFMHLKSKWRKRMLVWQSDSWRCLCKFFRMIRTLIDRFRYMFIGAVVLCRIEAPLEKIEHETYVEFRNHWTKRLVAKGISGLLI